MSRVRQTWNMEYLREVLCNEILIAFSSVCTWVTHMQIQLSRLRACELNLLTNFPSFPEFTCKKVQRKPQSEVKLSTCANLLEQIAILLVLSVILKIKYILMTCRFSVYKCKTLTWWRNEKFRFWPEFQFHWSRKWKSSR